MSSFIVCIPAICALIALAVAFALTKWIGGASAGTGKMIEISGHIREGAMAFLKREYRTMIVVIAVLFFVIGFSLTWVTALL